MPTGIQIALIAYGVLAAAIFRPLLGHFAYKYREGKREMEDLPPHSGDWFFAFVVTIGIIAFAPAVLVWKLLSRSGRIFPAIGEEKAYQKRASERALEEAEKDLGLAPDEDRNVTEELFKKMGS